MKKFFRSILDSDFKMFVLFFIYPAIAALFVQLIFLPVLFPQWNAGEGMLTGGDWYGYHQLAAALALKIHAIGWGAWELRPQGQGPSGVAAIFYVLFAPHPWVLIPLFAGLHAAAAFTLFKIIMRFTRNRLGSFMAVCPFWLYPSAMIWYTQIHKDGFLIAGALFILLAWMRLADESKWKHWQDVLISIILLMAGGCLAWIVRPYSVQMMQAVSIAVVILLSCLFVFRLWKRNLRLWQALIAIVVVWASLVSLTVFTVGGIDTDLPPTPRPSTTTNTDTNSSNQAAWNLSGFPTIIERKAYALATSRNGYLSGYPDAGSNIDVSVSFHSLADILLYLPRAAEIVFLAPFPPDWFKAGTIPVNTVMRRESGVEMIGVYLALLLLPYAVWRWRTRPDLWIVLIFCSGMMLIYGLAIANVGTLYRFRYGFLMTIVAVDLAAGFSLLQQWRGRKKPV